jgi:membrane AbrB-like protein
VAAPVDYFPSVDPYALLVTVSAVLSGYGLARLVPVPGGLLLLPMVMAVVLRTVFGAPVTLPPWIMYPCYALVGWRIGLTFTRSILAAILRLVPSLTLAIMTMVTGCALYSLVLWRCLGLSPLTAFLASCPGGLDAVTIIASGSGADLPFVMAMQAMRLLLVILSGPWLYSWLTRRYGFKRVETDPPPGRALSG